MYLFLKFREHSFIPATVCKKTFRPDRQSFKPAARWQEAKAEERILPDNNRQRHNKKQRPLAAIPSRQHDPLHKPDESASLTKGPQHNLPHNIRPFLNPLPGLPQRLPLGSELRLWPGPCKDRRAVQGPLPQAVKHDMHQVGLLKRVGIEHPVTSVC